MPDKVVLYRVFIASPGGLEQERRAFAKTLEAYNLAEAIPRQAMFLPVGWEDTLGGVGRPQSLINQDLDQCDYFVMALWDRWGTPPDADHLNYTSGTEEEYRLAMDHVGDPKHPLSEVVVFFKKIEDDQRLRDPGEQLKKVLQFKKELEADRKLLFSTFVDVPEFGEILRRHLAKWLREHDLKSTIQAAREAKIAQAYTAPGLVATADASPTTTSSLTINIFGGNRDPLPMGTKILFTVIDGQQQTIYRDFSTTPSITLHGLPFFSNVGDNYTVLAFADGCEQAGFTPVLMSPNHIASVDLMLVRKGATFNFSKARWDLLCEKRPDVTRLFAEGVKDSATAQGRYTQLMETRPAALACFFNLATALSQIQFADRAPLDCIRELIWEDTRMTQDRFFAWVEAGMIDRIAMASAQGLFAPESSASVLLEGVTRSWKQIQFGEANIQIAFHENDNRTIGGTACIMVEFSFDYYKDLGAHAILEIIANTRSGGLVDPRQVYALRWMAGRHAGVPEFDPPYLLD